MNSAFNPYASWLGLRVSTRSPNHYELLGLLPSETSAEAITSAADKATSTVRSIRPGEHAAAWAQLLDELAMARSVLLDPTSRAAYDAQRESALSDTEYQPESLDDPMAHRPAGAAPQQALAQPTQAIEMAVEIAQPSAAEAASKYPPGFTPPAAAPTAAIPATSTADPMAPTATPTSAPANPAPANPATGNAAAPPTEPTAYPASPQTPVGQAVAAPMSAPANPAMTPAGQSPTPVPVAQGVAAVPSHPASMGQASPAAIPVGQATAVPTSVLGGNGIGANKSTSKEASRRRKQAWTGPLTVLAGLVILIILTGAVYYGINQPGDAEVAENPKGSATETDGSSEKKPADETDGSVEPNAGASETGADKTGTTEPNSGANAEPNTAAPDASPKGTTQQATAPPDSTTNGGSETTQSIDSQTKTVVPIIPIGSEPNTPKTGTTAQSPLDNPAATSTGSAPKTGAPSDPTQPANPTTANPKSGNPKSGNPKSGEPTKGSGEQTSVTESAKPTQKEIIAFRDAMLSAYDATCLHDFKAAEKSVAEAKAKAKTEEHKQMAARLGEIAGYVKQYREALDKSVEGLASGTIFQVGEFTVAVVERGKGYIKIRAAGQTRHYELNALPRGTGIALGDMVLDQLAPSTKVLQGAYLLGHPRVDTKQLEQAGQIWRKAIEEGADIKHLLPALKDDYASIK